jgi:hypothetical protein
VTGPDSSRPSASRSTWIVVGLLVVALALAIAGLVFALVERDTFGGEDELSEQASRELVMSRAETFVVLSFTYDKSDLDDNGELSAYVDALEPMLTSEARAELPEQATGLAQLITETNLARTTEIEAVGVQGLDEDSAEVIVAGIFTEKRKGTDAQAVRFQMVVNLDHVDGEWLVNDFEHLGGETP